MCIPLLIFFLLIPRPPRSTRTYNLFPNPTLFRSLLPGAYYFMRETKLPPVDAMRRHGTRIALATDNNPGTSPTTSLLRMLNMGATLFRLTVVEALRSEEHTSNSSH